MHEARILRKAAAAGLSSGFDDLVAEQKFTRCRPCARFPEVELAAPQAVAELVLFVGDDPSPVGAGAPHHHGETPGARERHGGEERQTKHPYAAMNDAISPSRNGQAAVRARDTIMLRHS